MKEKLGDGEWISLDTEDEMVVNFYYPQIFEAEYLRSCVRLEIGPLAEWMPSHETIVTPFAAEKYPDIFSQKATSVLTIDVERTFWEKLTILHKIANFPEGKPLPVRYARHLYDVYNMGNSWVKERAFKRKELLEKDVAFKQKFYYAKGAHYETATLENIMLLPGARIHKELEDDYQAMRKFEKHLREVCLMYYFDKAGYELMEQDDSIIGVGLEFYCKALKVAVIISRPFHEINIFGEQSSLSAETVALHKYIFRRPAVMASFFRSFLHFINGVDIRH